MTIKELREKRAQLIAEARGIVETFMTKGEALSAEARERVDKIRADAAGIADLIERSQELEDADRAFVPDTQRSHTQTQTERTADERNAAVLAELRGCATDEQRQIASKLAFRDQSLTGSLGGYTIAPDTRFYGQIVEAMKAFGGMVSAPLTVITTETGADLPIPTNDDTGNVGSIVAEAGSVAGGTDVTLGQLTLRAYKVVAPIVKVSIELLQDSNAFATFLARQLGRRIARKRNALLTVGTGSSQHQGIAYSGASVGRTCATGFTTTATSDDYLRLKHSVDPEYRNMPGAGFMLNDNSLLLAALLKDGDGQYILKGLSDGSEGRIHGKPVYINQDMPDMAASAKSVAFGDFSSYVYRQVSGLQISRLNELYAANQQVGFLGWERSDGALVDAGMHPVRVMVNAAS